MLHGEPRLLRWEQPSHVVGAPVGELSVNIDLFNENKVALYILTSMSRWLTPNLVFHPAPQTAAGQHSHIVVGYAG